MPICVPASLPARAVLEAENIFVMDEERASHQDIRPLKIVLLNLMPTKIVTESQIMRLLSNSPLQVELVLLQTASYRSKNTPEEHLESFYVTFDDIRHKYFDGMIITGAPVENMEFEQVAYWNELCEIMEWTKTNVYSTFHICWAAQAGLYYHYGVPKYPLAQKAFGVFAHDVIDRLNPLLRGFNDVFYAPHSRHTEVHAEDIEKVPSLKILATSEEVGVYIVASSNNRQFFVTGHSEYDRETLALEYFRDVDKGLDIAMPKNYFTNDDPTLQPVMRWRAHANLLFGNWLNYCVYQETPYDIKKLGEMTWPKN
ncbi:MAG: homoserine O-succinyltransferase [Ruminococcaceae bacterium]|nr:homoserine O-succinyltransferase [Oscillospiraceae bacterium]